MVLVAEKKKRDFDVLKEKYFICSKIASGLFIVLLTVSLYLGFPSYHNYQKIDLTKQNVMDSMPSIYGPFNKDMYVNNVKEKVFRAQYKLPLIDQDLSFQEFFVFGPVIFLVLAMFFWFYLERSLALQVKVTKIVKQKSNLYFYPWIYNISMGPKWLTFFWQVFVEFMPIIFLIAMLLFFLRQSEFLGTNFTILAIFAVLPLAFHALIFKIKLDVFDTLFDKIRSLATDVVIIVLFILFIEQQLITGKFSMKLSVGSLFVYILFFGGIEIMIFGRAIVTFILFRPLSKIIPFLWYFFKGRLKEAFLIEVKVWKDHFTIPFNGYIGYLRDKYNLLRYY